MNFCFLSLKCEKNLNYFSKQTWRKTGLLTYKCANIVKMGGEPGKSTKNMKYVSLVVLTVQNALLGLSMRYARTKSGDMFLSSTAVVMSEVVKLFVCLGLVYVEEGKTLSRLVSVIRQQILQQPWDTIKVLLKLSLKKLLTIFGFRFACRPFYT